MSAIQQALSSYGGGVGTLLLDMYTGAAAAYSVRKLRTAYGGACLRIRNSTTTVETDIGFNGSGNLDTAAITAAVGAASATVVTWYDQSGNSVGVTQSTTTKQPRIVNAGTLDTQNSLPAMLYDGTDDALVSSYSATIVTNNRVHMAVIERSQRTSIGSEGIVCLDRNTGYDYQSGFIMERRNSAIGATGGTGTNSTSSSTSNYQGWTGSDSNITALSQLWEGMAASPPGVEIYIDNTNKTLTSYSGAMTLANFLSTGTGGHRVILGGRSGNTTEVIDNPFQGYLAEVVIWSADQSANRSVINANQKLYFGTP